MLKSRDQFLMVSVSKALISFPVENLEISGNLLILENSGNVKYTLGIFAYQMVFFRDVVVVYRILLDMIFCNYARSVPK